ncbi:iron-siderophore ABC transporter substrate-binding protein [uncultured Serinicoccus sp.]|uniref:iron-siderophore ABC transporter substrate-binding protein n=1 Tax=uncultured Serinicoccus sp. TaxID=735514 RepID=UPI0026197E54|nr:iron-siderophore ABC transporter substrate-binding protein [uncultured Serinicoccus sp.]
MRTSRTASVSAALTATLVLAACGGSSAEDGADADGGADQESAAPADAAAFPVTVEHALGETTIEEQPERVASVAWANHEVPLALGIVPVGMSEATWGDDDGNGVLPWVEDALAEMDAETPVLFDETDGIDFEAVADTEPDVILAAYSGLTQEEYDTLSQIAPVVAYPELAWGTTWQQMVELNSQALGMAEEGDALVEELEGYVSDTVADYPELEGMSAMFSSHSTDDLSQVGFYTTNDPRALFLEELGMSTPELVAERSAQSDTFYETVSAENADLLEDVDLLVTYGDDALLTQLQDDALVSEIPAVEDGAVVMLENDTPLAAAANPSPLALEWGLTDFLDRVSAAAEKSR